MATNILIVEPNQLMNEEMCKRLRSFGFSVESTGSIAEATHMAAGTHPDLVLIDHSIADQANSPDPTDHIPWMKTAAVVLVANSSDSDAAMSADTMGASSLLTQPFSGNDLLDSVSHALWHDAAAANDANW